jgi:hypothetical protein
MALLAYFDTSGTEDLPAISSAGFIAEDAQWHTFETAWATALSHARVNAFHMREFAHSTGEYSSWKEDEERRRHFVDELAGVIRQYTLASIAVTTLVEDYNRVDRVFQLREHLGSPYAQTTVVAMLLVDSWRERNRPTEDIAFYIEKGDENQADLVTQLQRHQFNRQYELLNKRCERGGQKRCALPFQASDFLAWEIRKAQMAMLQARDKSETSDRWTIDARASLMLLDPPQLNPDDLSNTPWRWADERALIHTCLRLKVPLRTPQ